MSVSVFASLRPSQPSRCLRHATTGHLSVRLQSRNANLQIRALVPLRSAPQLQRRWQSSLEASKKSSAGPQREQQQQKLTFRQFVGRALVASFRKIGYAFTPKAIKKAYRDYPGSTVFSILLLVFVTVVGAWLVMFFYHTFYTQELSVYPRPIADTLRRAIHATIIRPDPDLAGRMYTKALKQCAEMGLDPFSDEVLGIKIRIAAWLEQVDNHSSATQTLEVVKADCLKWIGVMEKAVEDGKVDGEGNYVEQPQAQAQITAGNDKAGKPKTLQQQGKPSAKEGDAAAKDDAKLPENLWHKRQRLLAKAISTSVKLGELYADEHILDGDKSHEHLVWAVEQSLKEFHRRKVDGTRPGETHWLTPTELGGSIESLARDYERKSQYQFVIPLYFSALRLCEDPCHRVVIMNNLSAAFAQHPLYSPPPSSSGGAKDDANDAVPGGDVMRELFRDPMPRTRDDCLEAAQNWAQNAHAHAADVKPADRTPECDVACAVALCNWGDVAAMRGKPGLARKKYAACVEMSTKLGFEEGVAKAKEGLARLAAAGQSG